ncbi:MAG: SRPBCC family protein [Myxococcota bacterium]
MWSHRYEHITELTAERLWPILANIEGWPSIDENIDTLTVEGQPAPGARFFLKPKGGPRLSFVVTDFQAPHVYSDTCRMPFAKMKTTHRLCGQSPTRIVVDIQIEGPLAWFWGRTVGRKHASGLPAQTERFIEAARATNVEVVDGVVH